MSRISMGCVESMYYRDLDPGIEKMEIVEIHVGSGFVLRARGLMSGEMATPELSVSQTPELRVCMPEMISWIQNVGG